MENLHIDQHISRRYNEELEDLVSAEAGESIDNAGSNESEGPGENGADSPAGQP